ncbi:MAG: SLATT domain-containing protein, partial [Pseudomonadota bacterium]|nr:SLATT domain-containing protein [Pseudomonadota bacterium]
MAFSDDIWWTRKARIQTEKRLLSNAFHSQLSLLWYSLIGASASIYYLKFSTNNELAGVAWVIYSVMSLVISVFISGLSFKERAGLIKDCYERLKAIQKAAYEIEQAQNSSVGDIEKIGKEYGQILSLCENHSDIDYVRAICLEHLNTPGKADDATGLKPNLSKAPSYYQWFQFFAYNFIRWS